MVWHTPILMSTATESLDRLGRRRSGGFERFTGCGDDVACLPPIDGRGDQLGIDSVTVIDRYLNQPFKNRVVKQMWGQTQVGQLGVNGVVVVVFHFHTGVRQVLGLHRQTEPRAHDANPFGKVVH